MKSFEVDGELLPFTSTWFVNTSPIIPKVLFWRSVAQPGVTYRKENQLNNNWVL